MKIYFFEGNIAAGKTELLSELGHIFPKSIVINEPVKLWQNVGPNNVDLLALSIASSEYAFQHQIYTFTTTARALLECQLTVDTEHVFVERSVCASSQVFEKANSTRLNGLQLEILKAHNETFIPMIEDHISKIATHKSIFYLQTIPEVCIDRIRNRKRISEEGIKIEYLQILEKEYANWFSSEFRPLKNYDIRVINANLSKNEVLTQAMNFIHSTST